MDPRSKSFQKVSAREDKLADVRDVTEMGCKYKSWGHADDWKVIYWKNNFLLLFSHLYLKLFIFIDRSKKYLYIIVLCKVFINGISLEVEKKI